MRRVILAALICSVAGVVLVAQESQEKFTPINVKTGSWENTIAYTLNANGLPLPPDALAKMTPEQRAKLDASISRMTGVPQSTTYKKCITREDLAKDPFTERKQKCNWTTFSSTGTKVDAKGTCMVGQPGQETKVDINIKFEAVDTENVKGTGQVVASANGKTIKDDLTFTGKWLGATCPSDVD